MSGTLRIAILAVVLVAIGAGIFFLESTSSRMRTSDNRSSDIAVLSDSERVQKKIERGLERAKEITTPDGFINASDFDIESRIGKEIILVDFWTYSCINCQRTLPYLNAWHQKYQNQGLSIVGVHTPEFKFEEDYNNVSRAVERFDVEHAVVLDNDYSTWQAYKNRYWPRKYIIDIDGFIAYDHIGEGAYEETERVIQELLRERSDVLGLNTIVPSGIVDPENAEVVNREAVGSRETYLGAWRNEFLGNGAPGVAGERDFELPEQLRSGALYFDGLWNLTEEHAESREAGTKIVLPFKSQKVFLVGGADEAVRAKISLDGKIVSEEAGVHVKDGYVTFQHDQLYRLIDGINDDLEHVLEIEFEGAGFRGFAFTFG